MLSQIRHLILDMDGVLWHGDTPTTGLVSFFATLDNLNIGYVMATNNASKTTGQYASKFQRFGLDVDPELILTSAETTASHLSKHYAAGTPVYIVGADGLRVAMRDRGFEIITAAEVEKGAEAPLIVMGFTPDAAYQELAMAALLVNKGASFIGTNPDPTIPSELGPLPGTGALQALITAATGVSPKTIGKPGPLMFEHALRRLGSQKTDTAMVGDRLATDIAGAKKAGLWAILLLSGISTREEIQQSLFKPDYIFEDIGELGSELVRLAAA